jgi:hypothetical protein
MMIHMGKIVAHRGVAAVVAAAYLFQTVVAPPVEAHFWSERRRLQRITPSLPSRNIAVESTAGAMIDPLAAGSWVETGGSAPTIFPGDRRQVVFFRDAHRRPEAQARLSGALQHLLNAGSVDCVALEGAFGALEVERFRAIPDRAVVRAAAEALLQRGDISGPIHAALTSAAALPPILGVDDAVRHAANVDAYRRASARRASLRPALEEWARSLERRKERVCSPALRRWDDRIRDYRRGRVTLCDFAASFAREGAVPRPVADFLDVSRREASLDFVAVERERRRLIERLGRRLSADAFRRLAEKVVAFQAGRLSATDFYQDLGDVSRRAAVPVEGGALTAYVRYLQCAEKVDADALIESLESLERATLRRLSRTDDQRRLMEESRRHELTTQLVDFSLTAAEWEEYKNLSVASPLPALSDFEDFYRIAESRDAAMAERLLRAMDGGRASTVVWVAGGFHGAGVTRILRRSGVEVSPFTPRIERWSSGEDPLREFIRTPTPLERLFDGEAAALAPHPFPRPVARGLLPAVIGLCRGFRRRDFSEAARTFASLGGEGELAMLEATSSGVEGRLSRGGKGLSLHLTTRGAGDGFIVDSIVDSAEHERGGVVVRNRRNRSRGVVIPWLRTLMEAAERRLSTLAAAHPVVFPPVRLFITDNDLGPRKGVARSRELWRMLLHDTPAQRDARDGLILLSDLDPSRKERWAMILENLEDPPMDRLEDLYGYLTGVPIKGMGPVEAKIVPWLALGWPRLFGGDEAGLRLVQRVLLRRSRTSPPGTLDWLNRLVDARADVFGVDVVLDRFEDGLNRRSVKDARRGLVALDVALLDAARADSSTAGRVAPPRGRSRDRMSEVQARRAARLLARYLTTNVDFVDDSIRVHDLLKNLVSDHPKLQQGKLGRLASLPPLMVARSDDFRRVLKGVSSAFSFRTLRFAVRHSIAGAVWRDLLRWDRPVRNAEIRKSARWMWALREHAAQIPLTRGRRIIGLVAPAKDDVSRFWRPLLGLVDVLDRTYPGRASFFHGFPGKVPGLQRIAADDEPLLVLLGAHGDRSALSLTAAGDAPTAECILTTEELGEALLRRARGGARLSDDVLLACSCESSDFSAELLRWLSDHGASSLPVVIAAADFERPSSTLFYDVLKDVLSHDDGRVGELIARLPQIYDTLNVLNVFVTAEPRYPDGTAPAGSGHRSTASFMSLPPRVHVVGAASLPFLSSLVLTVIGALALYPVLGAGGALSAMLGCWIASISAVRAATPFGPAGHGVPSRRMGGLWTEMMNVLVGRWAVFAAAPTGPSTSAASRRRVNDVSLEAAGPVLLPPANLDGEGPLYLRSIDALLREPTEVGHALADAQRWSDRLAGYGLGEGVPHEYRVQAFPFRAFHRALAEAGLSDAFEALRRRGAPAAEVRALLSTWDIALSPSLQRAFREFGGPSTLSRGLFVSHGSNLQGLPIHPGLGRSGVVPRGPFTTESEFWDAVRAAFVDGWGDAAAEERRARGIDETTFHPCVRLEPVIPGAVPARFEIRDDGARLEAVGERPMNFDRLEAFVSPLLDYLAAQATHGIRPEMDVEVDLLPNSSTGLGRVVRGLWPFGERAERCRVRIRQVRALEPWGAAGLRRIRHRFPALGALFSDEIIQALLRDPALVPIFLHPLPEENLGPVVWRSPELKDLPVGNETAAEVVARDSVFSLGSAKAANDWLLAGHPVRIGLADRPVSIPRADDLIIFPRTPMSHGRTAHFLLDGVMTAVKSSGMAADPSGNNFEIRGSHNMGLSTRAMAERAFDGLAHIDARGMRLIDVVAFRELKKIPDPRNPGSYIVPVGFDEGQVFALNFAVNLPRTLHRPLHKMFQLLEVDPGLERFRRDISASAGDLGMLPKGVVLETAQLLNRMAWDMGVNEAGLRNAGYGKQVFTGQDVYVFQEADLHDLTPDDDLSRNDTERMAQGIQERASALMRVHEATARLNPAELHRLFPDVRGTIETLFLAYLNRLDEKHLRRIVDDAVVRDHMCDFSFRPAAWKPGLSDWIRDQAAVELLRRFPSFPAVSPLLGAVLVVAAALGAAMAPAGAAPWAGLALAAGVRWVGDSSSATVSGGAGGFESDSAALLPVTAALASDAAALARAVEAALRLHRGPVVLLTADPSRRAALQWLLDAAGRRDARVAVDPALFDGPWLRRSALERHRPAGSPDVRVYVPAGVAVDDPSPAGALTFTPLESLVRLVERLIDMEAFLAAQA